MASQVRMQRAGPKKGTHDRRYRMIPHHSTSLSTLTAVSFFRFFKLQPTKTIENVPFQCQHNLNSNLSQLLCIFFTFCLHHQTYQEPEIVYPPLAPVMASSSSPTWKTLGNVDPATGFGWCRLVIDLIVGDSLSRWHEPFVQNKPKSTLRKSPSS